MPEKNLLKDYRKAKGYTQLEVGKLMGHANGNQINFYENLGRKPKNLETIVKLARFYKVGNSHIETLGILVDFFTRN